MAYLYAGVEKKAGDRSQLYLQPDPD